jgi:hypothetical protein
MAAPGAAAPGTTKDAGPGGAKVPAEAGHGRPESGRDLAGSAIADSPEASSAWPRVSLGTGGRPPAESALAAPGALAGAPAGIDAADEPRATETASVTADAAATDSGSGAAPAVGLDDQVSVVPGIARYHKADCILIRFLSEDDLERTSRRDAEAAGCAPCRACRPDQPSATG